MTLMEANTIIKVVMVLTLEEISFKTSYVGFVLASLFETSVLIFKQSLQNVWLPSPSLILYFFPHFLHSNIFEKFQ